MNYFDLTNTGEFTSESMKEYEVDLDIAEGPKYMGIFPMYMKPKILFNGSVTFRNSLVNKVWGFGGSIIYSLLHKNDVPFEKALGREGINQMLKKKGGGLKTDAFFLGDGVWPFKNQLDEGLQRTIIPLIPLKEDMDKNYLIKKLYIKSSETLNFDEAFDSKCLKNVPNEYWISGHCYQDFGVLFIEPSYKYANLSQENFFKKHQPVTPPILQLFSELERVLEIPKDKIGLP